MNSMIEIFSQLGRALSAFGTDSQSRVAIDSAVAENAWFTEQDIHSSVNAIRTQMLDRKLLEEWLSPYPIKAEQQKDIAIIMAGNIPLVGFFDLLCVIVCGHRAHIKPSSKDRALIEYIVGQLKSIAPSIPIYEFSDTTDYDAVIATGSDNTNRYFKARFGTIPALLRGNRFSAAIISGTESDDELQALAQDIFQYNGLGCRNVSQLLIPNQCDAQHIANKLATYTGINPKYINNYRQQRALHIMNSTSFVDGGFFTMTESADRPQSLSEITYTRYESDDDAIRWIDRNEPHLQCIVSNHIAHTMSVCIGRAQSPRLCDYPDRVDVIKFICEIAN